MVGRVNHANMALLISIHEHIAGVPYASRIHIAAYQTKEDTCLERVLAEMLKT